MPPNHPSSSRRWRKTCRTRWTSYLAQTVFSCTRHTPEWLPNITTHSSSLLTLLTQVSSALKKQTTTCISFSSPFHLFSSYNKHSGAAGHPVPSGSGWGGAAFGRASGGREAAGPPVPRSGSVPGEDLWRLEGPGSQMTNVRDVDDYVRRPQNCSEI